MNYIFIDANIYLKFYLGIKLNKVLDTIIDNRTNLIVTQQIADEVLRNSVSSTAGNIQNIIKNNEWKSPSIPYRLENPNINAELKLINENVTAFKEKLDREFITLLEKISKRKDDISLKLDQLFTNAMIPTEAEFNDAKDVKAFGNPPGKKSDPIGDELSWIQIKNKLNLNDKLILVTNDRDYATVFNKISILNSKLNKELEAKNIECFVFIEIMDGIKKLKELQENSHQSFDDKDFPDSEEQVTISNEEKSIFIGENSNICLHPKKTIILNGIYEEYRCIDCNSLLMRKYFDD